MRAQVWGCRGSLATPGADTVRYGGNTSCVGLRTKGGARNVYKKQEPQSRRTGGSGKLQAIHAALILRDEDFWPS